MDSSFGNFKRTNEIKFILHGDQHSVDIRGLSPETTLNDYLRNHLHLTGTKYMCREGGCGACIVSATFRNPRTGIRQTHAVNSCLVSIYSCGGWDIKTVESLGNRLEGYHPIQQKIVQFNGTQCGFCTPGMVMNMHALMQSAKTTMANIENSFGGNICRCTGYRPILSAFKSMASDCDEAILGIIPDIEELNLKTCQRKDQTCQETCRTPCSIPLIFGNFDAMSFDLEPKNWYQVTTVRQIFDVINDRSNRSRTYKLVAGNTAGGVFPDMKRAEYYVDIANVAELKGYSLSTLKLTIGANCTLSETIDIFRLVSQKDDGYKHLTTVITHLDLVASLPIRNLGTIAGNLMIKHIHPEFPSDIFLILETIRAQLVLSNGKNEQSLSPREFFYTDMSKRVILKIEIPPLDSTYKLETYKIMPRAQNSHAHVNAGFLFKLNATGIVQSANIVFGGINPDFVHATLAENFIKGKQLFDNGNLQQLYQKLGKELVPDNVLPTPKPEYRKQVAIALMYKYVLSIAPKGQLLKQNQSGGQKLIRPAVSTGIQDYKTNKSMYPIGESINKLEAADQASGAAEYVTDIPDLPNQLFAAFVLGKEAAGSILKSIDPSDALEVKGVEAFYQASDIDDLGGVNSFMAPNNSLYNVDEEIFLPIGQAIKFYYEPIGVIVAKSKEIAEEATELVKVEFTPATSSPLLTPRDLLKRGANDRINHQATLLPINQDLSAPIQFSGSFDISWQYHFHMELQVTNVVPEDDGGFNLRPSTQWMDGVQYGVARALNIPNNMLNISVKRVGGSFGGKLTRNHWPSCAATLAALRLRKPVKFLMPLSTNMNIMGKRNAIASDYKIGVDANGRVGFLDNDIYSDNGAYGNSKFDPWFNSLYLSTYVSDAYDTTTYWVRTDNPAATSMRAPGSLEGCAIIESIMEHIAYKIKKDPIDVRLTNLNVDKQPLLKQLIDECLTWSDYRSRRADIEKFNEADGTVAISHGGIECGQGINTHVAQVAAYLLGIDIAMIQIKPANNFVSPNSNTTAGTVTTEGVTLAVQKAIGNLKQRIDDAGTKSKLPATATWLQKVQNAYVNAVSLTENQMFQNDPDKVFLYYVYGVAVSEVEVDILTGKHIIQRVDLLEDVGDSMNPGIDIGQCEGGFMMGVGYWTTERIVLDDQGALTTNNTWTYKPPGAKDIPVDFRVKLPDNIPNPLSPFKSKGTSEPPTCLAVSVPLAIRHALSSARVNSDPSADPWTPFDGPSTVDWIFMNGLSTYKQYTL